MKTIAFILLLFLPCLAFSQSIVKGKINDTSGKPLDGVTVTLSLDQKVVASAFADLGNFNLKYPAAGTYMLSASLVGYEPLLMQIQLPKDSLLLVMQASSKQLNEVTISYRRPLIERKIDRLSFNVENSILATGGSAWEAVSKTPGVQITASNEVTANRKNVRIYMDGKPLEISGDDLQAYLQGLPSDQVARIELFSNPPAQFDAEGASVINIISKSTKKQGLNLSLNSAFTQATYSRYSAGTSFNYRKDKLNIFGSYSYARRHNFQDHDTYINFGTSFWSNPSRNIYKTDNHTYRAGADYQLSENQVLGVLFSGNNRNGTTAGSGLTSVISNQQLDSTLRTDNFSKNQGNQYTYNLNYNLKLDSGKSNLNIDADYSTYNTNSEAFADNRSFLPDGSQTPSMFHIFTPSTQDISIYSGKVDYTYQIAKVWDLSSGIKYSSTESKNTFDYFDRVESTLRPVPENGNHFTYKESTAAAYTSLTRTLGKLTLQAGLRAEHTRTRGYSITLDSLNQRNYFKLFPTFFGQYKINDQHELLLNYAYRINRPEYNRLNPAKRFSSPYNIYVGNPALQPSFVHSIELGYTFKQNYNLTAYYTQTQDLFTNINIQDNETKIYYGTHANLGYSAMAGLRVSATIHPLSFWEIYALGDLYRQREKSAYLSGSYDNRLVSFGGVLNQSFTIKSDMGLKAEINGVYNGPGLQGIYRSGHNTFIDAGIKTDIFAGKGNLRLAVSDIFNTNYYNVGINFQDQQSRFFHQVESRSVTLSLSYRLGKNLKAARSRTTASEEERKRAQ
ncbi:TonB-dependent receptor [Pedobacter sp. MC2016-15]|uniref:TonB-dependent receptor domain-containing protein n=1 Tax=Pedobacter sp. MC2016-15 TaxID=2994473 RepID=UPI0022478F1B|nr:TonB-dependent receptor [Pedobacter sp. MC2016-15]MCX2478304.1 TonB-dependent receptor [Pedobacter sp. MC2016-15]